MVANKKLSDGVGKKIVEALKKQSEIEVNPVPAAEQEDELEAFVNSAEDFENEYESAEENILDDFASDEYVGNEEIQESEEFVAEEQPVQPINQPFVSYPQMQAPQQDTFMQDLDTFEIPSNIAVLKKLITQLPSGVTRHTGAQIIKQTMEALGISMKSVLQEAQQVQEGLNNSVSECHANIQEYKKQITVLEKQAQNYQKQYTAMNELISLFIQTGI